MSHSSGAEVFYNSGAATVKAPSPPVWTLILAQDLAQ